MNTSSCCMDLVHTSRHGSVVELHRQPIGDGLLGEAQKQGQPKPSGVLEGAFVLGTAALPLLEVGGTATARPRVQVAQLGEQLHRGTDWDGLPAEVVGM